MSLEHVTPSFDEHLHDALSSVSTSEPAAVVDVLAFSLADRRFAIATREILLATTQLNITPVPSAPADVLGIALVAGRIATVLSVSRALLGAARDEKPGRWLIVENDTEILALGVDELVGIVSVREDEIHPHVAEQDGQVTTPFTGYVDDATGPVSILDLQRLVAAVGLGAVCP